MKKILMPLTQHHPLGTDLGLLFLRVSIGLTMAFAHGWGKIPPSAGFIDAVGNLGFPLPGFFAWMAALSEFAGALLITLGLLTRPSAALLAITMAVAFFLQHAADPFRVKELAFIFMCTSITLMLTGAGRFSLDNILSRRCQNQ